MIIINFNFKHNLNGHSHCVKNVLHTELVFYKKEQSTMSVFNCFIDEVKLETYLFMLLSLTIHSTSISFTIRRKNYWFYCNSIDHVLRAIVLFESLNVGLKLIRLLIRLNLIAAPSWWLVTGCIRGFENNVYRNTIFTHCQLGAVSSDILKCIALK